MAADDTLTQEAFSGGFGIVDEKGRLSLSKPARGALGIEAGSTVALLILDGALLVVPQDEHLAELWRQGQQALSTAGLTASDFLAELPAARAEVVREAYGDEFLRELERMRAALPDE